MRDVDWPTILLVGVAFLAAGLAVVFTGPMGERAMQTMTDREARP